MKTMKRFFALTLLSSLLLSACGGGELADVDSEVLDANPELKEVSAAWEHVTEAVLSEDCEDFFAHTLARSNFNEVQCKSAKTYLENNEIIVDWEKAEFNGNRTRVKLSDEEGELAYFELVDSEWLLETNFWAR